MDLNKLQIKNSISAKDARQKADDIALNKLQDEITTMYAAVHEHMKEGVATFFNRTFSMEAVQYLRDDGYMIATKPGGNNETDTIIKW